MPTDNDESSSSSSSSSSSAGHAPPPPLLVVVPPKRAKRQRPPTQSATMRQKKKKSDAPAAPEIPQAVAVLPPLPPVVRVFDAPSTPHMRMLTNAVQHFYTVISALAPAMLTETNVTFNERGMYLTALNDSKTIFVDWRVTEDSMEGMYSGNHTYRVKLNMEVFVECVHSGKKFESMQLEMDGVLPETLTLRFTAPDRSRVNVMRLMQEDDEELIVVPDIRYDCSVSMPSTRFKEAIYSIHRSSNTRVEFEYCRSDGGADYAFHIRSHTQLASTETSFRSRPDVQSAAAADGADPLFSSDAADAALRLQSTFYLDGIASIVKVTNATRFVTIYPADVRDTLPKEEHKPMRITYEISTLGPLSFYIAPCLADASGAQ
ncbi:MAG: hypothetical protein KGL42_13635 [Betaproteobacteria bacterium]|nr:hypothetical protein [Betaproteobacteria bacterium]